MSESNTIGELVGSFMPATKNRIGKCWSCGSLYEWRAPLQICAECLAPERFDDRMALIRSPRPAELYREIMAKSGSVAELLTPTPGAPEVYARATAEGEVAGWAKDPRPALLVLTGPTGTGKTWQAWGALRALRRSEHAAVKATMLQRLDADAVARLIRMPALLIDDLAARTTPGALATALEIVDQRQESAALTIVTTNATLPAISDLEPRLASRLAAGRVVQMGGRDRRLVRA
jgi:DNA replication protein DnaC